MKITLCYISLWVMLLLAFAGCDVHEFPEERYDKVPFQLHLDFSTEMPLYKEVVYTRSGDTETKGVVARHDIRYTISAYRIDNMRSENRVADTTFVFTRSEISDLNYTANLLLREGTYDFKVWADYVDANSMSDKYYDTREFSEIILANKDEHLGSNDYRDAFRGYATATVINPVYYTGNIVNSIDHQASVEMKRPMGKFKFISTDLEAFVTRVARSLADQGVIDRVDSKATYDELLQLVSLYDYEIVFRYNMFMPCSFNMFTDKPADSWTGMSFKSLMHNENNKEITLGFDYIFVNGSETTLSISVEVYNPQGEMLSATKPVNVPIVRSKLTIVRGEFLTSEASGGVAINPDFDGPDYNIEIK